MVSNLPLCSDYRPIRNPYPQIYRYSPLQLREEDEIGVLSIIFNHNPVVFIIFLDQKQANRCAWCFPRGKGGPPKCYRNQVARSADRSYCSQVVRPVDIDEPANVEYYPLNRRSRLASWEGKSIKEGPLLGTGRVGQCDSTTVVCPVHCSCTRHWTPPHSHWITSLASVLVIPER